MQVQASSGTRVRELNLHKVTGMATWGPYAHTRNGGDRGRNGKVDLIEGGRPGTEGRTHSLGGEHQGLCVARKCLRAESTRNK